ncbi:MAG: tetratricopeptide repeat protein [Planctomycetota bacterium]|jgi:predicted Zn-dependent protease
MAGPIIVTAGSAILWITASLIGCGPAQDSERPVPSTDGADPHRSSAIDTALAAAEQYLDGNELASAETILAKLIEQAPADYRAHELYGRVRYLQGVHARREGRSQASAELLREASRHYDASVEAAGELDPVAAAGLNQSAGEIASAAGLPDRAVEHFQAAGRLDPTAPKHPLYEAQVLMQLERPAEARQALQRVLALDPDEAYAHASLATVALREGDRASALRHIQEARDIAPGNLGIRIQEARIRRQCDQPRHALELLLALDDRLRAEEAVTTEIAECHLVLGEPLQAARAWEHRYRRHPRQPTAWRAAVKAAEAHLAAGRRGDALWWCRQAQLGAPDEPEVRALQQALEAAPAP